MAPEVAASGFSFPLLVEEIRRSGLTAAEVGRITGVKERQVQNWASGSSKPTASSRDRLIDIHYIVRQLSDVYRPEGIEIWIHSRNAGLGGDRPIDLLFEGDFEHVLQAVIRLQSGST